MIQRLTIFTMLLAAICLLAGEATAGNYIVGAKYWQTEWDSAILDWFEEDISPVFLENNLPLSTAKDAGKGYLTGPLIGYQTDDGKWSFSIAPMVFSRFDQDWRGMAGPMTLDGSVSLERMDIDVAAGYTLNKFLKAYVGYKYQTMDMDFILSYHSGIMGGTYRYNVESTVHMPTVGLGSVYSLHEKVVVGLQGGILYTIPDLTITEAGAETENIRPWPGVGFNVEGNITYRPFGDFVFQAGYRYQVFEMEARGPGRTRIIESYDITQGWTATVLYVF